MGYTATEEITIPTRFLVMTSHFIAVLTILFGVDTLTSEILISDGMTPDLYDASVYTATRETLYGLAWGAVACFIIEYIGLFTGVSIFQKGHACAYILLHFAGTILTALFYTNAWTVGAFTAFFVCFNALPATLELMTLAFTAKSSFVSY